MRGSETVLESSCILAWRSKDKDSMIVRPSPHGARVPGRICLENLYCLRCSRQIGSGQKSVAVYLFAQTVGIKPRQKSAAQRIGFCPECSVSLAMGPPPEGALNLAAWTMIREMVASDPTLTEAAWENLSGVLDSLPPTGTSGAHLPPQTGGYFEF